MHASIYPNSDSPLGIHLVIHNETLRAGVSHSDDVSTENAIPFKTWSHFAMQYNHLTGEQSLFINGQLNATVVVGSTVTAGETVELLLGQTDSAVLSGAWIDEVTRGDLNDESKVNVFVA